MDFFAQTTTAIINAFVWGRLSNLFTYHDPLFAIAAIAEFVNLVCLSSLLAVMVIIRFQFVRQLSLPIPIILLLSFPWNWPVDFKHRC
jgi:hypothetical protein